MPIIGLNYENVLFIQKQIKSFNIYTYIQKKLSSGQDGGVGRNPSLTHTTKRRRTTNLKSINN